MIEKQYISCPDVLDFKNLLNFIVNCNKYNIESVHLSTTSNYAKHFNNFFYVANITDSTPLKLEAIINGDQEEINNTDQMIISMQTIQLEINGYDDNKVHCYSEIECMEKMKIIYSNIMKLSNVKRCFWHFKGKEIKTPEDLHKTEQAINQKNLTSIKADLKKELYADKEFQKEMIKIIYDKNTHALTNTLYAKKMVNRILHQLKSKKNSYIISGLIDGELTKEDISKYPDLIKAVEEIKKIKLLSNL